MTISDDKRSLIIQECLGSSASEHELAEKYELDDMTILDILADANIERCPTCEWWVEAGELVDDENELVSCLTCRGL